MSGEDYESLPTTSVAVNMTAGALAGVLEHCIMYPLDSVKTRMQSLSIPSYDISETFRNMIRKEGIMRPVRGVTAVVAGAGPAHALYFGSYEMTKELFTKVSRHNNLNYMASGAVATVIHDAVSNPTEVIKQRMQMYDSPYRSVVACMKGIYQAEGLKAFYRSYSTQLVMNVPYQAIHFVTYEFFQNLLNTDRKYNPPVHVVAGGAAGAAAAAVTTPLDVVKTLLNTQEVGFTRGMAEAIKRIYTLAGPFGFFKGLSARVLYAIPATAICWSTYEFFKYYLCGIEQDQYKSSITGKKSLLQPKEANAMLHSTILREATLVQMEPRAPDNMYVLPPGASESVEASFTEDSDTQQTSSPPHATAQQTTGSIKSVCDLSATSVATPTLNLNTRHTDVKTPYDRGLSRT